MTRVLPCHRCLCCVLALSAALAAGFDASAAASSVRAGDARSLRQVVQPFSPGAWHANITANDASPSSLIAVDKKQQALFLFERHSPLRPINTFTCTTGQNVGDKLVEGDLKTPEGVYFVVGKVASGLDYEKYGYEAYILNYPNPVDKLRRKTGYGIWIHGRGVPIAPNLTEGCVSLNNTDIAMLGKTLVPGTPVALAEGISFTPQAPADDIAAIRELYRRTYGWANAWSAKSGKFFDYYDADAYAIAQGESFSSFRVQKERVFKHVKRLDVTVKNVQALQGPGYWVTWFEQDYRASNLSAKGVRRLYWQKDRQGELRIVGMEWAPHLSGTLTAGLNGAPVSDESAAGAIAIAETKLPPGGAAALAERQSAPSPAQAATGRPKTAAVAEAATPEPKREIVAAPPAVPGEARAHLERITPPPAAQSATQGAKGMDVPTFVETWRSAWERGDVDAYASFYAPDAVQGSRYGRKAIHAHKRELWRRNGPSRVELTNIRIVTKPEGIWVDMHQVYTNSGSFADMGIKTLYLQSNGQGWQIVREDWSPMR